MKIREMLRRNRMKEIPVERHGLSEHQALYEFSFETKSKKTENMYPKKIYSK